MPVAARRSTPNAWELPGASAPADQRGQQCEVRPAQIPGWLGPLHHSSEAQGSDSHTVLAEESTASSWSHAAAGSGIDHSLEWLWSMSQGQARRISVLWEKGSTLVLISVEIHHRCFLMLLSAAA